MVHSANESSDPVQRTLIHSVGHSVSLSRILYLVLLTSAAPLRHRQNKKSNQHMLSREEGLCAVMCWVCLPGDIQRVSTNNISCSHIPVIATYQHFTQPCVYHDHFMSARVLQSYCHLLFRWTQTCANKQVRTV